MIAQRVSAVVVDGAAGYEDPHIEIRIAHRLRGFSQQLAFVQLPIGAVPFALDEDPSGPTAIGGQIASVLRT